MSGPYRDAASGPTPLDEAIGNAVAEFLGGFLSGIVKVAIDAATTKSDHAPLSVFMIIDEMTRAMVESLSVTARQPVRLYCERSPICREATFTVRADGKTLAQVTMGEERLMLLPHAEAIRMLMQELHVATAKAVRQ